MLLIIKVLLSAGLPSCSSYQGNIFSQPPNRAAIWSVFHQHCQVSSTPLSWCSKAGAGPWDVTEVGWARLKKRGEGCFFYTHTNTQRRGVVVLQPGLIEQSGSWAVTHAPFPTLSKCHIGSNIDAPKSQEEREKTEARASGCVHLVTIPSSTHINTLKAEALNTGTSWEWAEEDSQAHTNQTLSTSVLTCPEISLSTWKAREALYVPETQELSFSYTLTHAFFKKKKSLTIKRMCLQWFF